MKISIEAMNRQLQILGVTYYSKTWFAESDETTVEAPFRGTTYTAKARLESDALLELIKKIQAAQANDDTRPSVSVGD